MLRFQEFSASLSSCRVNLCSLAALVNWNRKGSWLLLVNLGMSDTTKHSAVSRLRIWLRSNRGLTNPCLSYVTIHFLSDSSMHFLMSASCFAYLHAGILFLTCLSFNLNLVSPCCKQLWQSTFAPDVCFSCQLKLKINWRMSADTWSNSIWGFYLAVQPTKHCTLRSWKPEEKCSWTAIKWQCVTCSNQQGYLLLSQLYTQSRGVRECRPRRTLQISAVAFKMPSRIYRHVGLFLSSSLYKVLSHYYFFSGNLRPAAWKKTEL